MKNVPRLAATLLLGAVFSSSARADDPAAQNATVSDLSLQDPDGVPLVISHPKTKQPSQSDVAAEHQREQQANADQDWLLHGYEQQLQSRASRDPGSENNNLYLRIVSDKNLSKLAGVSSLESPNDTTTALKTGAENSSRNSLALRPDSAPTIPGSSTAAPSTLFKPLITPLGATDAAGLHNFYGSLPAEPIAAPQKPDASAPGDLDMPGKVAADNDPMAKASLTFDAVQDDALPEQGPHQDQGSQDDLSNGTNDSQIQKLNDAALIAPGSVKTTTTTSTANLQQLKLEADPPMTKIATPSPVRQPIVDPYSILDR